MGLIKLNGVNYWGSNYGAGIVAPMIYSDEEREVGVWRDNKPLHQKTFNITPTGSDTTIDVSSLNIETLVARFGGITRNTGSSIQQKALEYRTENPTNNSYGVQCEIRGTNLFVSINGYTYTQITNIRVTLQYTKTTDVAGSGNWNTNGIPTHHYSTNEQVIGTWIDGKPLYECTVDGLSLLANASWTAEVATNLNIKYLANATLYDNSNPTNPIVINVEQVQVLNGGFRICHGNNSGRTITRAVIQYTKTTD